MAPKSLVGWTCSNCTFFHSVPSPRCVMCAELRNASRQQMRDFVQGKTIPPKVDGNVVELLSPEMKEANKRSEMKPPPQPQRPPPPQQPQQRKPVPVVGNPYRQNSKAQPTAQKKDQTPTNPFFAPTSSKNVNRNPYATRINANEDPWSNQRAETNTNTTVQETATEINHALHPPPPRRQSPSVAQTETEVVVQNSRQPLQPRDNWISASDGNNNNSNNSNNSKKAKHNPFASLSKEARVYVPGPVPMDPEAAKTWIYPQNDDFPTRQYQLEISETALFYNTLVSLPTGLGKTLIAGVVLYNYYRWFPTGKLIFMAPTLPLVSQQAEACYNIMGIPEKDTAILTGKIKPAARFELWRTRRVFYCTPQTVQKDLLSEEATSFSSQVCCIVLDEAHKASGDYAYTKVVEQLELASAKFRIVGLSATPGTTIKAIQQVVQALRTAKIEARQETDPTVVPYIHQKHYEIVIVPKNDDQKEIERQLTKMLDPVLERLRSQGALRVGAGNATLTAFQIHKSREEYVKRGNSLNGPIFGYFQAAYKLVELRNDTHHSLGCVKTKILRLKQTPQRGILSTMVKSTDFQNLFQKVLEATGSATGSQSIVGHGNPKLKKLAVLLHEHFCRARATEKSSRAIVFSQFRDSVSEVVELLKTLYPLVRARHFVGQQGSKSSGDGADDSRLGGMKQSEQHQVIKWFREDVYNVLVCTCIGEEGLDIGEVDLIVNFDTLRSPIRMIQRTGRTGRKRDGRVVCLISEGQEERTYMASKQAEKTLNRALRNSHAFTMAPHQPLFPHKPTKQFSTIEITSKFRMSQVGHVQTSGSRKSKKSQNWRLSAAQEEERGQRLGRILVVNQDWRDFRALLLRGRRRRPQELTGGRSIQILRALERLGPTEVARIPRRRGGGVVKSLFPLDPPSQEDEESFFPNRLKSAFVSDLSKTNPTDTTAGEPSNSIQRTIKDLAMPLPPPTIQHTRIEEGHADCTAAQNSESVEHPQKMYSAVSSGENYVAKPASLQLHITSKPTTIETEQVEKRLNIGNGALEAAKENANNDQVSPLEEAQAGLDSFAATDKGSHSCTLLAVQDVGNPENLDRSAPTNEFNTAAIHSSYDKTVPNEADQVGRLDRETEASNKNDSSNDSLCPGLAEMISVFRLPTPPSSSDEEDNDEDCDHDDDSRRGGGGGGNTVEGSLKTRGFQNTEEDESNANGQESVDFNQEFCFRLPTQDSSSSSGDDETSDDEKSASSPFQKESLARSPRAIVRSDQNMFSTIGENLQNRCQPPSELREEHGPAVEWESDSAGESDMPLMSLKMKKPDTPLSSLKRKKSGVPKRNEEGDMKGESLIATVKTGRNDEMLNGIPSNSLVDEPRQILSRRIQDRQDVILDAMKDRKGRDSRRGIEPSQNADRGLFCVDSRTETQNQNEDGIRCDKERKKRYIVESPDIGVGDAEVCIGEQGTKKRRRILSEDTSQSPLCSHPFLGSPCEKPEALGQLRVVEGDRAVHSTPHANTTDRNKGALTDTPGFATGVDAEDMICSVCFSRESLDEDPIVLCDGGCNLGFHKSCYSICVDLNSDTPWLCDECDSHVSSDEMACVCCSGRARPLRKVKSGDGWCHPLCTFLSPKATSSICMACSRKGAVKCFSCAKTVHPYCAIAESGLGLWTLALVGSNPRCARDCAIFCPDHTVEADAFLSQRMETLRDIVPSVKVIQTRQPSNVQRRSIKRIVKKDACPAAGERADSSASDKNSSFDSPSSQELLRKKKDKLDRLKKRRLLSAKFVVDEAKIHSDEDFEGDDGEENDLRLLEEEENMSQDSFINDSTALTQHFSQDEIGNIDPDASHNIGYHHRSVDAQRVRENQFKTPVLNRQMRKMHDSQLSSTSSQKGLGNMHFVRSVIEHHRQGGDADEIEALYHQVENEESEQAENSPVAEIANGGKIIMHCSSSDDESMKSQEKPKAVPSLTAAQKRMIELKRLAALEKKKKRQGAA